MIEIQDYDKSDISENASCGDGDKDNQLLYTQKQMKDRNNPFGAEPSMVSDTQYQDDLSVVAETARNPRNDNKSPKRS